jgi:hypothetical protein
MVYNSSGSIAAPGEEQRRGLMVIPRVLVGIGLLTLGRKAFWLFVGGVGFVLGLYVATQIVGAPQGWLVLVIGLAGGLLGALLALVLQHVAVGLAGFVAGGYVAMSLAQLWGWELDSRLFGAWKPWLVFVLGGILFAVLIGVLFEWALIVLSSVTGATLITQAIRVQPAVQAFLFAVLVGVGVVVQAILYRSERSRRPDTKAQRPSSTWR